MFGWGYRLGKYGLSPVQFLILLTLKKKPMYGYEIIKDLKEKFGDIWEPKTGTIYPALRRLETKGLVKTELRDDKEFYILTEKGEGVLKYATDLLEVELDFVGRYHKMFPPGMKLIMMKKMFKDIIDKWKCEHFCIVIPPIHLEHYNKEEIIKYLYMARESLEKQLKMIKEKIKKLEMEKE